MTTAILSNGLRVGNLASPHEFVFSDGTRLAGADPETCRLYSAEAVETETPSTDGPWSDVAMGYRLTPALRDALAEVDHADDVDIVLVSLPTLTAIKAAGMPIGKCRVVRLADRVAKTVCIDRFCI